MRCLVTGGAGFIGSHLSERLLRSGHEVTAIDDLSTGSVENILSLRSHPDYEFHGDSIFNRRLMAELVDLADIVFHLAAAVGVKRIVDFPVQTIETNVGGTEIVMELAAKKQRRLLIASTSEVYGKSNKLPFSEVDDLVLGSTYNHRWAYACSKAIDEFLALAYFREYRLPVTILRLFNTVGPRQTGRYGMVVPTFVRQALLQQPLTVFGDGTQSRCFAHVSDVIDGFLAVAADATTVGEIFNLGNTEEISMTELAERVIAMTGSSSQIRYVAYSEAYGPGFEDMSRRIPDIAKAQQWLGFKPKYSLDAVLRDVIAFTRHQVGRERAVFVTAPTE
ncbi:MAG TPA: GDP-mannose 4,6-dehydratase [Bryocella sp.]|nr:GDP-mannose 4,6-dehydratase [Bryocella sp.]